MLFLQFGLRFIIVLCLSVFCFSLVYFHHEEWQSGRSGSLTEARMVFRMKGVVFGLLIVLFLVCFVRMSHSLFLEFECTSNMILQFVFV